MTYFRLRYAIQREDGAWFCGPNPTSSQEWCPTCSGAHLWVDHPSCIAAAWRYRKVREEDIEVYVRELVISPEGTKFQLRDCA